MSWNKDIKVIIMELKKEFTDEDVRLIHKGLGIKWDKFDLHQFRKGMNVELEHGTKNAMTNVTDDDILITGKIALVHLKEFPDYYDRLEILEKEAAQYWKQNAY